MTLFTLFAVIACQSYSQKDTLTLSEYMDTTTHNMLSFVYDVKPSNGMLIVSGYRDCNFQQKHLIMNCNDVLKIHTLDRWPKMSIITIPFKYRFPQDTLPATVSAGISNVGVTIGFFNNTWDQYFMDGRKISQKLNIGFLIAPSIEEISPENTKKMATTKSKQLFISTGISLNYSYNDIAISLIPIGYDIPTSLEGRKYVYTKPWFGFGIGVTTKIFSRI